MARSLLTIALALGVSLHAYGLESLGISVRGARNTILDDTDTKVSASDGYIVTFWYGSSATDTLQMAGKVSYFADYDYGASGAGMFQTMAFDIMSTPDADIYLEARIFQYDPNLIVSKNYVNSLTNEDLNNLRDFWDLIGGTDVSHGVLTYSGKLDADGAATSITFSPSVLKLAGIAGTVIPESSTWAAIAGLAILGYVAVRRRRR